MSDFDVVIIGGGMVGTACAAALSGKGLDIALVEANPPLAAWPEGEIDLRVSAISRASQRILTRLGAWERIRAIGATPYRRMEVWDRIGRGIHFDCQDLGEPDLGHIIENRAIQLALWERLDDCADITRFCPASIIDLQEQEPYSLVQLGSGEYLRARLIIGADGRDSQVRRFAGIDTNGWEYAQRAIVAHVRTSKPHRDAARQHFLPTGPLALLPLHDGRCSIVWSADDARADELMALDEVAFSRALTQAFDERLGELVLDTPRASFPLRLQHARSYVRPGLALIGDAAHAIHPLAGQGVNLGLLDAAELSATIDLALRHGRDIRSAWVLRHYERARRGDNLAMLYAMDVFKRLFGNGNPPLGWLRSLGLLATDRLTPVKRAFMAHALGLSNDLPPLARP